MWWTELVFLNPRTGFSDVKFVEFNLFRFSKDPCTCSCSCTTHLQNVYPSRHLYVGITNSQYQSRTSSSDIPKQNYNYWHVTALSSLPKSHSLSILKIHIASHCVIFFNYSAKLISPHITWTLISWKNTYLLGTVPKNSSQELCHL